MTIERERWTHRLAAGLTPEELADARASGYEPCDGYMAGRDPRGMSPAELTTMGHEQLSPMQAIRARCLDCCGGSPHEVRYCAAVTCPSWPFRTGKNPWRAPPSETQRENARRMAASRSNARNRRASDDEDDADVS